MLNKDFRTTKFVDREILDNILFSFLSKVFFGGHRHSHNGCYFKCNLAMGEWLHGVFLTTIMNIQIGQNWMLVLYYYHMRPFFCLSSTCIVQAAVCSFFLFVKRRIIEIPKSYGMPWRYFFDLIEFYSYFNADRTHLTGISSEVFLELKITVTSS